VTVVDWPIVGLVLGFVILWGGVVVKWVWYARLRRRAAQQRLAEEQTAANARALRTLTDDARRRTKHEYTTDQDSVTRFRDPRTSTSETTQRRPR